MVCGELGEIREQARVEARAEQASKRRRRQAAGIPERDRADEARAGLKSERGASQESGREEVAARKGWWGR